MKCFLNERKSKKLSYRAMELTPQTYFLIEKGWHYLKAVSVVVYMKKTVVHTQAQNFELHRQDGLHGQQRMW